MVQVTEQGYVFICHHSMARSRWTCACGGRRALMCVPCAALDHVVLDVTQCNICRVTIEYQPEPPYGLREKRAFVEM